MSEKDPDQPILLEEPIHTPDVGFTRDSLFGGEGFAMTAAKHVALEAMLKLLTRNCRFSDFTRELLVIIIKVVQSEAGSILEVDHGNRSLFFRAVVGQSSDQITQFTVPLGQGIAGYVAESLQPLVVSNIKENRIHLKAIERAVGFETRNLVALPLVVRGKIYGVLELLNRIGEPDYTTQDLDLLTYLSETASRVLEIRMMIAWSRQKSKKAEIGAAAQSGSTNESDRPEEYDPGTFGSGLIRRPGTPQGSGGGEAA